MKLYAPTWSSVDVRPARLRYLGSGKTWRFLARPLRMNVPKATKLTWSPLASVVLVVVLTVLKAVDW